MNFLRATKFRLRKSKWVIANSVETIQPVMNNALKGCERVKSSKTEHGKVSKNELTTCVRDEHSFYNTNNGKVQRDIFGATILPSNLSFDSMKKLSMNQIKLEEIPLVDENDAAEALAEEKLQKMKEAEAAKGQKAKKADSGLGDCISLSVAFPFRARDIIIPLDISKADPFEKIPGPRLLQTVTSTVSDTTRRFTAYFLLKLLRIGSARLFKKYGPIVRLPDIFGGKILMINHCDHISSVYAQDLRDPATSCLETLECSRLRRHGKRKDAVPITREEWQEKRKAIDEVLLKGEDKYFDCLEENGNNLVRRIRAIKNRENEVPRDFVDEINKWSLECLLQILFDKEFGFFDPEKMKLPSKNVQLLQAVKEATRMLITCDSGLQLWRFMSTSASVSLDNACQIIESILSDHVFQAQLNQQKRDGSSKPLSYVEGMLMQDFLTRKDVMTCILDFLLIGMNAMTNALSFMLYYVATNPRTQKELFLEIKKILPEKYTRLEYDQVRSLKYLQSCLKESLRLKMPLPILTKCTQRDVILSNYHIPRGTLVLMAAQLEAIREENFENPQEFRPERWMDNDNKCPFTELPLSVYTNSLFETRLAELSLMTCAAQIIRNFSIEYNYGTLSAENSTISYPVTPLRFGFFEREF